MTDWIKQGFAKEAHRKASQRADEEYAVLRDRLIRDNGRGFYEAFCDEVKRLSLEVNEQAKDSHSDVQIDCTRTPGGFHFHRFPEPEATLDARFDGTSFSITGMAQLGNSISHVRDDFEFDLDGRTRKIVVKAPNSKVYTQPEIAATEFLQSYVFPYGY
jgi:hypothetical protein